MKSLFLQFALVGIVLQPMLADDIEPYSPAEPFTLSKSTPNYFFSDLLTFGVYYMFNPDGRYVLIYREHLGVDVGAKGTWAQSSDGIVTLNSETQCADVVGKPLYVQVSHRRNIENLGELVAAIQALLDSTTKSEFSREEIEGLEAGERDDANGKWPIEVGINTESFKARIRRDEVVALVDSINEFLDSPTLQEQRMVPLSYKGMIFLVNLNSVVDDDHREACIAIDEGRISAMDFSYAVKISEEKFKRETNETYPFKFFPEMNKR